MTSTLAALAQSDSSGGGAIVLLMLLPTMLIGLAIYIAAAWKLYAKMGQPGWTGIVPILNIYVVYKLSGREWWFILLYFLPCVGIIAAWFFADDLAKLFGKSTAWSLLLFFFGPLAMLALAFGSATYVGPTEKVI